MKTFWGWADEQLPDGTVIWTAPSGEKYVTHPGCALIFPGLCAPTAPIRAFEMTTPPRGDRNAMMPKRTLTRAKQRAADITAERAHNHEMRTTPRTPVIDERQEYEHQYAINYGLINDPDPPPF